MIDNVGTTSRLALLGVGLPWHRLEETRAGVRSTPPRYAVTAEGPGVRLGQVSPNHRK
jgi:hypothetical protein